MMDESKAEPRPAATEEAEECKTLTPLHLRTTRCKLVIVEGNISAGKSTLCRTLANELQYVLYLEPTVENPFLEPYYKEPKKYALPMQLWLLKQRFVTYVKAIKYCLSTSGRTKGVILDRSIWSDIVFAEKNYLDGNFSKEGYDYYMKLRAKMLSALPAPHVVVYLDASPETCHHRIHKMRQRECEDGIPLAYLQGLDDCYRNFVKQMQKTQAECLVAAWNEFGSISAVSDFILAAKSPSLATLSADADKLHALVSDPKIVAKAMTMPYSIEEAGADIEVADPDFITSNEVRVMPAMPTARTKRAPPARSPQPTAAKSRRTGESPTSIMMVFEETEA